MNVQFLLDKWILDSNWSSSLS